MLEEIAATTNEAQICLPEGCKVTAATSDAQGRVWLGLNNGRIAQMNDIIGDDTKNTLSVPTVQLQASISFIKFFGDTLFCGLMDGRVVQFSSVDGTLSFPSLLCHTHSTRLPLCAALCPRSVSESQLLVGFSTGEVCMWNCSLSEGASQSPACIQCNSAGAVEAIVATVHKSQKRECSFITGGAGGQVTLWATDGTIVCRIFTASENVTALCTQVVDGDEHVWVGTCDGSIYVYEVSTAVMVHAMRHVHSSRILGFSSCEGECKVWSICCDGTVTAWDPISRSSMFSHSHHGSLVALVPAGCSFVWKLWSIEENGCANGIVSQAVSHSEGGICDHVKELESMLDESLRHIEHLQQLRTLPANRRDEQSFAAAALLQSLEEQQRRLLHRVWGDSTESLLVSFFVSQREIEGLSSECQSLRHERDFFKTLVERASKLHAVDGGTMTSPNTRQLDAELHHAAHQRLNEREEQIRLLQNELLRLRRDSDEQIQFREVEREREVRVLREIVEDQRRKADTLREIVEQRDEQMQRMRGSEATAHDRCKQLELENATLQQRLADAQTEFETRKGEITAAQLELNELQLEVKTLQIQHEHEVNHYKQDIAAMRVPWEAMKRTLAETQAELDHVRQRAKWEIEDLARRLSKHERRDFTVQPAQLFASVRR